MWLHGRCLWSEEDTAAMHTGGQHMQAEKDYPFKSEQWEIGDFAFF